MSSCLTDLLSVLDGSKTPPVSGFLSFSEALNLQQISDVANALKCSPFAGGLRLKGCTLNDSGAELLAEAVAVNQCLSTLELPGNNIGCRGADAFASMLQSDNSTLTTLDLAGNPCETYAPQAMDLITSCLRRNRLGLFRSPSTPQRTMGPTATPPTAYHTVQAFGSSATPQRPQGATASPPTPYHTVQPFSSSSSPDSKASGSPSRVLQSSGKENWALSTGKEGQGTVAPIGMGAIELEYRLQHIESTHSAMSSEVEHIKALGSNIEGWKHQMNDAGAQAAAVLALVQSDGSEIRARLSDLDSWRVQVESASQHFDGLLGGLRGNWYRMEERFDQIANRLEHKRTPRAIDCSPYQQQVQQVREQCQQELELLHANVEEVQQAQQALAANSGMNSGSADLDLDARLEALSQDLDDVRGTTHRLERYVEQMLRQMLGSLNAGQQRLKVDHQGLLDRLIKSEKQQAVLSQQLQQGASGHNQMKTGLRGMQRQIGTMEAGQAKMQQEVAELGQFVELMKGRKGPALPWQRAQEQALLKLQEKVTKLESLSADTAKAAHAESSRTAQAEAHRDAQTAAFADSLQAFKQTQAAELAKRDADIALLRGLVTQLQAQLPGSVIAHHELLSEAEEHHTGTSAAAAPAASRSETDLRLHGRAGPQGQGPRAVATALKGADAGTKARVRLSLDGRGRGLKPATALQVQKRSGAFKATLTQQQESRQQQPPRQALSEVSLERRSLGQARTALSPLQVESPERSATPPLLANPGQDQCTEALQQQVVQQQADINRLEHELAALHMRLGERKQELDATDGATPSESPSISRSPSPPRQRTISPILSTSPLRQRTNPPVLGSMRVSKASSNRLTGNKRALSSRSNQNSARQLTPKQRVGSVWTAGRSSNATGRSSAASGKAASAVADVLARDSRPANDMTAGRSTSALGDPLQRDSRLANDMNMASADNPPACTSSGSADVNMLAEAVHGMPDQSGASTSAKDSSRSSSSAADSHGMQAVKQSPARLLTRSSLDWGVALEQQGKSPMAKAGKQQTLGGDSLIGAGRTAPTAAVGASSTRASMRASRASLTAGKEARHMQ